MATICKTCGHYQEIPDEPKFGICFLELPPWVNRSAKDESRVVNGHDTCDLWNVDKANNA